MLRASLSLLPAMGMEAAAESETPLLLVPLADVVAGAAPEDFWTHCVFNRHCTFPRHPAQHMQDPHNIFLLQFVHVTTYILCFL